MLLAVALTAVSSTKPSRHSTLLAVCPPGNTRTVQVARNHHTVPRLFLKGFALNETQLSGHWRDGRTGPISVAKATVIRDFYDPKRTTALDDSIETWFSREVENLGAGVVDGLRQGTLPTGPAMDATAMFVAFQMVRGASFRRVQMEVARTVGPVHYAQLVVGKMIETDPDFEPTDEEVEALATELRPRAPEQFTTVGPDSMMRNMLREAQRIKTLIPTMHWSLASSSTKLLLTSDTPVVTRGPAGEFNDGPDVLPDGFEVLVPVSPARLLVVSPYPSLASSSELTAEFAREVNERQVRGADELVLRHPQMAWPADVVLRDAPPALPTPRVTIGRSQAGQPPTEMVWPSLSDSEIRSAMNLLGGDPPLPRTGSGP